MSSAGVNLSRPSDAGDALLIDSTHKRWSLATLWLAVAAVGLYIFFSQRATDRLTGGTTVGLWYGTAAAGLMIYAGLLSYHRRRMRTKRLGNRKSWLRGHIWLGLLSGPLALMHSGFSWGRGLEIALWIVLIAILATGVIGLVLQNVLPRLLTTRIPCEAPYEQIPYIVGMMRSRADVLMDKLCGPFGGEKGRTPKAPAPLARMHMDGKTQLRAFYECDVRPFLVPGPLGRSPMLNPLQTQARFTKLRRLEGLEEKAGNSEENRQASRPG